MKRILIRIILVLITALVHYLIMEYLNNENYFDFKSNFTFGKIIMSLCVGILSESVVKMNKVE